MGQNPHTFSIGSLLMRLKFCALGLALACALPVMAQSRATPAPPPPPADHASCQTEEASLEQDIALARSRGQMLRRRQLNDALIAVQTHCAALAPVKDHASRIRRQEQEVATLREELSRAEAYLSKLKAEAP
jgi:hypothetical protein